MNDEVLLPGHGLPIVGSDRVERRVYEARRDLEPSTVAKGIFGTAARGSEPDG